MQFRNAVDLFVHGGLRTDSEAMRALREFLKNVPSAVLDFEADTTHTFKQGMVDGEKVYKFGVIAERYTVFIEFYENKEQPEPSMSLYVDKTRAMITIRGAKKEKKLYLAFVYRNGEVERLSNAD